MKTNKCNLLSVLLLLAAMAIGNSALAQTFNIEATYNSNTHKTLFTITRSGSSLPQQTIKYRTVNLSAYAGQHYTAVNDTYTFPEGIDTKTVEVKEGTPGIDAYKFQNGTTRSYRFEVLDVNGFLLAYKDRSLTSGVTVPTSGIFDEKTVTIQSSPYLVTDDGYLNNGCKYALSSNYFNNAAPKTYFQAIGAQLRMTLSLDAKESNDGYQYLQILFDNTVSCDSRPGNSLHPQHGHPGTPNLSRYTAGFEMNTGSLDDTYRNYSFPVTSVGSDEGATNPWGYGTSYPLSKQLFKSNYRASDGRLIVPTTIDTLVVRLNASGSGDDDWYAKNVKAHIQAVDATKPTLLNGTTGITVSAGPYVKGNTFYISVPFSEIVHISGALKKLHTSWGDVEYVGGDYTNVITYKGTINANAGTTLAITGIENCLFNDLAGNYDNFSNSSFDKTFTGVTCVDSYTLAATNTEFTGLQSEYVVSNTAIEPHPTVYFYKGKKENANKVQLTENTNYTLSWANNNAAGTGSVTATGTGNYNGSISATYPIRWSTYTVSFHGNGSVGIPVTGTMSDQAFQYGVAQSLSANAFSRVGFTFAGWNTQPDGSGQSYSDIQEVLGLTTEDGTIIDLYAQWTTIPWTGSGDSEEDPYVIMYPSQLDLLASNVNGGNEYNNKFFKLGADITYSYEGLDENESNYTPIGTGSYKFHGTFDGNNKTISGIRIYTTNDSQGVFKYVSSNGTVKNVVLANSIFKGKANVGGIAGRNNGILTNCRIEGSVEILPKDYISLYHGGIVGENLGTVSGCISAAIVDRNDMPNVRNYGGIVGENASTGTVKDCLYTGSTVDAYNYYGAIAGKNEGILTNNYYTTEGIWGVGVGIANPSGNDCDGARRARVITLGDNVAIEGDQTTYDVSGLTVIGTSALSYNDGTTTTIYSGATQDITLSDAAPQGYAVTSYSLNGTPLAGNSFTMPDSDVTVNAIIGVPYIDADGNEPICTDYTLIESSTGSTVILGANETETWYAVSGNVNITVSDDKAIETYGAAHLILMDDATLTVEGQFPIFTFGSLSIYGQSLGTGCLTASGNGTAIYVSDGTLTINGGIVTATSSNGSGIYADNAITINGGGVSAGGNGLKTIGTLTLGWRNATDRIYASSYYGDNGVVVKSGQYLSDGTAVYSGSLSDTQIDALAGQTLQPVFTLTLPKYVNATSGVLAQEGRIACALADANVTLAAEGCTLADVTVGGEAATDNGDGTWSFIMPATDATVSATVTAIDFTTGHAGTEADPYIIMYRSQLDLLATRVNGGTNYNGKFIKLGADIAYDPNDLDDNGENYTAIGTMVNYKYFKGSFDGDGHIVSGIRINKTGQTDADKKQGLFGYVQSATIKNVVLSDASITGYTQVGGIVGDISSNNTIQNCLVLNSHIIANSNTIDRGVIAGFYTQYITLIDNYYYNCTVNGASTNVGAKGSDRDGARGVNKLTLCEHVIATPAAATTYQGNSYYVAGTSVTLSVEEGYTLNGSYTVKDANNNDVALTGGDTFEMPASDVTVSADITVTTMAGSGTEDDPWIIMYRSQMDQLAISEINNGEYYQLGRDLTYSYEGLGETESNFTPICVNAGGHFDGAGHTISGIRIYPHGKKVSYLGLFGINYGTVKNVTLTDAIITGEDYVGGIVGSNTKNGLIDSCHVTSTVIIKAYGYSSDYHGGISGDNAGDVGKTPSIRNCTSAAILTNNGYENCGDYGGIVGENVGGIVSGCTAYGASVTAIGAAGGIVGYNYWCCDFEDPVVENCFAIDCTINSGSAGAIISNSGYAILNHNYYYNCTANGNTTNIGYKDGDITENDGAVQVFSLTLGEHITATATPAVTYNNINYHTAGTSVTLSPEEGYAISGDYTVKDADNNDVALTGGDTFEMPDSDVTVSATTTELIAFKLYNEDYLVEGDYLIVYQNYAMNNVVSNDKFQFEEVDYITNDVIGTNDANIIWHIAHNDDFDYWTIYNAAAGEYAGAKDIGGGVCLYEDEYNGTWWSFADAPGDGAYYINNRYMYSWSNTSYLKFHTSISCFSCYEFNFGGTPSLYRKVETFTKDIEGYTDDESGWYLIASPVSTTPSEVENMLTDETAAPYSYDLYRFNQSATAEWENYHQHSSDFNIIPGQGYLYANSEDVTLTFTGWPYSGDGVVNLTKTEGVSFEGWNLVGNPWIVEATIEKDFYRMNDNGSEIIAATGNTVNPMEGIFVQAEDNNEEMTFTPNSNSTKGRSQSHEPEQIVINLSTLNSKLSTSIIDRAIVRFDSESTLPKLQLFENNAKLYIPQNGKDYAIAYSEGQGEMPLNFKAHKNGEYTLTVSAPLNSQFSTLNLIDNLTGANINLLVTQSYTFTAKTTDYASRFKLVFNANGAEDNNDFAFIDGNGNIIINGSGMVQIFDMLGRVLVTRDAHSASCLPTSGFPRGVYVLRLINGDQVKTQKIVVK